MQDSLRLGGRATFEGKLDVVIASRRIGRREMAEIYRASESSEVPMVVLQVDNLDSVENYFMLGRWIKPQKSVGLVEAIKLIASHLKIDITVNKMVVDCLRLGCFVD